MQGDVLDQAVPTVKGLLSDADLRKAHEYCSDDVTHLHLRKWTSTMAIDGTTADPFHCDLDW